ncbi:MAG: outer membrane beta-barrel protein [Elusimicrobiales bacterium]|nr:outer membrane beta-barrel protein [Elusimicrobiales bacterium]
MKIILLIAFLFAPNMALADDLEKWTLSLSRGAFSEKKQSGVSIETGPLIGFEAARRFSDKIDIGFEFSKGGTEKESVLLPGLKFEYNNYFSMIFLNYSLDKVIKGLYIGPQAGIIMRSYIKSNDDIGLTGSAYGLKAGYDLNLSERLSFGLQAQYVKVSKADKTVREGSPLVDVTYSVPKTSFMKYLLALKYRF